MYQEESRGVTTQTNSRADMAVLKLIARPGGSLYSYDYCLVESKRKGESWPAAVRHLRRHCAGTEAPAEEVYGIVQVGEEMEFYKAKNGELTKISDRLHFVDQVADVMNMCKYLKVHPLPLSKLEDESDRYSEDN
jgi:hypothetical protein